MPGFNAAPTVESAIRAIAAQTTSDWELIVIDDGSSDDTVARVQASKVDLPANRLRLVKHTVNRGVAAARNTGLTWATGDFVVFVDSDDIALPNYLADLHGAFESDIDVVIGGREVRSGADLIGTAASRSIGTFDSQDAVRLAMLDRLTPFPWDKMFRRTLFDSVRFPEGIARFEDMVTNIALYARARRVRSISTPVYRYQITTASLTWGRVPLASESTAALASLTPHLPKTYRQGRFRRPYRAMRMLMTLLVAQAAISRDRGSGSSATVVRECRASISMADVLSAITVAPRVGGAGALLKAAPRAYAAVYLRHIAKTYNIPN